MDYLPTHVAIILDGNRRWAVSKGMMKLEGHLHGAQNIKPIAEYAQEKGVQYLTLYTLSTENLQNRGSLELKKLFSLFQKLSDYLGMFREKNIRVRFIGNIEKLPENLQKTFAHIQKETASNEGMILAFAVNYGGRDEILRAIAKSQSISMTEESFSALLDTAGMPDVDLVIRTGGHLRLSNFLLWQSAYSELYFTSTMWPAFTPAEFQKALDWFAEQKRNKGK